MVLISQLCINYGGSMPISLGISIILKFKGNANGSGELLNDWKLDSDDGGWIQLYLQIFQQHNQRMNLGGKKIELVLSLHSYEAHKYLVQKYDFWSVSLSM